MEYYMGQVVLFAFGYAPQEFQPCNGQILQITQNQALFALIGATYGGNGSTTFALPNLNGASGAASADPIAGISTFMQYHICVSGIFPSRS